MGNNRNKLEISKIAAGKKSTSYSIILVNLGKSTLPPLNPAGLSVCLRFLTDFVQSRNPRIFTLSPSSSNPLTLGVSGSYWLSYDRYRYANIYLQPSIRFWSEVAPDIWTRVCITLDSSTNVVQLFSGSYMSIRKLLPYSWTGEPVITFSGFDGQVTDIQVWDYPLRYREVTDYMNPSAYKYEPIPVCVCECVFIYNYIIDYRYLKVQSLKHGLITRGSC
uniref:Pentraxin n=1 Tax=Lates calcarifer TaxID=8187 RepID=A0A4W6FVJ9_LATCA